MRFVRGLRRNATNTPAYSQRKWKSLANHCTITDVESQKELYETLTMQNALKELRQTSSFTGAYTNIDDT